MHELAITLRYPILWAFPKLESYCAASLSSIPNASVVRIEEIASSAIVAAVDNSATSLAAIFATIAPPAPNIATIAGTMQERINVNFHCFAKAMTKPEMNVAEEAMRMATYHVNQKVNEILCLICHPELG